MRMWRWLVVLLALSGCKQSGGEPSAATGDPPKTSASSSPTPALQPKPPPAAHSYLGRELAPTMSHEGAPWLTRPERDDEENTTLLHQELRLKNGDVACDLGAGNGYHTLRMARAVAPKGKVLAVDIQPEMISLLTQRAAEQSITNVETILGADADPKLPAGACDLILLVDVYHELSDPAAMLAALERALSPRGVIALVEYRAEDPAVPIKKLHKMSKAQILREYTANGLKLTRSFDGLPWQHLMFFGPEGRD